MLLEEIKVHRLLSFGPDTPTLEMRALNVFIGPNGVGKSNLIEAVSLLQSAPRHLAAPVRDGGGVLDWLWKGDKNPTASIEVVVNYPQGPRLHPRVQSSLRHMIAFRQTAQRFELVDERIENRDVDPGHRDPYFYYRFQNNRPVLNVHEGKGQKQRHLQREELDPEKSILAQRKDPDQYPEITYLGDQYERVRIYREWSFGRYSAPRLPQKPDQRNDFLEESCVNLGLMLNRLMRDPARRRDLLQALNDLYPGIDDIDVAIEGGSVQVFLQEGQYSIPATRLSDGTLRYLCLLTILLHPEPPPLVCIEEPELGLHPDVLSTIGPLLKAASERMQLVVTTHSDELVDSLSATPDDVIVCEKVDGCTSMRRLDAESLDDWLERYALGELWRRGDLGGNRW
jgi:predicted ATPase